MHMNVNAKFHKQFQLGGNKIYQIKIVTDESLKLETK